MFERVLIHVDGIPGAGKTAFIEAVLADSHSYGGSFVAVRARHDESADKPRVRATDDGEVDPELRRYRAAGAMEGMEYHFKEPDADAFFMSDVGQEPWDVALVEGDEPTGLPQLVVHVLPASAGPLLGRRRFEDGIARLEGLLADQGMPLEDIRRMSRARDLAYGPPPSGLPATEHWAIAEEHRALARARLVVVNVRGAEDRAKAEALLAEVARLRGDPEVFADLEIALIGGRTRITAVAADLTDAEDPGTRRALARIRRAFPPIG